MSQEYELELKYVQGFDAVSNMRGLQIKGYASLFNEPDQSGDIVMPGAYSASLARLKADDRQVKMLWQHDPSVPIGIWDEVIENDKGLFVRGRLLDGITKAQEAAKLIEAGALDGLSIGYRTIKSSKNKQGQRLLHELDLWEVSLVTFPMHTSARVVKNIELNQPHHDGGLRGLVDTLKNAVDLTSRDMRSN